MKKILETIKKHKIATTIIALTICVITAFVALVAMNEKYIEFSMQDNTKVEFEYGTAEQMQPVTAVYKGTIFNKKGTPAEVSVEGQ